MYKSKKKNLCSGRFRSSDVVNEVQQVVLCTCASTVPQLVGHYSVYHPEKCEKGIGKEFVHMSWLQPLLSAFQREMKEKKVGCRMHLCDFSLHAAMGARLQHWQTWIVLSFPINFICFWAARMKKDAQHKTWLGCNVLAGIPWGCVSIWMKADV